jgi:hypothetical protein
VKNHLQTSVKIYKIDDVVTVDKNRTNDIQRFEEEDNKQQSTTTTNTLL